METTNEQTAAHTPGPWRADAPSGPDYYITSDCRNTTIAAVGGKVWAYSGMQSEAFANARLIAAAPDLLEACRDALACIAGEKVGGAISTERVIRAAIAKATASE